MLIKCNFEALIYYHLPVRFLSLVLHFHLGACRSWRGLDVSNLNVRCVISTLSNRCALRSSSDIRILSLIWLITSFSFWIESKDSWYSASRLWKWSTSWSIFISTDLLYRELSTVLIILTCLSESMTLLLCWLSECSFASIAFSFVSTESIE